MTHFDNCRYQTVKTWFEKHGQFFEELEPEDQVQCDCDKIYADVQEHIEAMREERAQWLYASEESK